MAGYKCLYVPGAIVYHKVNRTVGRNSDFLLYHSRRNVEYTFFKNMPFPLIIVTFPLHFIYNLLTFVQAFLDKRIKVFLKSKKDFLKNFKEIYRLRKKIQENRKISLKELFLCLSNQYLSCKLFLNLEELFFKKD